MKVIAEYSVPAADFVLGRAANGEVAVELERIAAEGGGLVCYVWTDGTGQTRFERSLRDEEGVQSVERVDELADRRLYRVHCSATPESLLAGLVEYDAEILTAEGAGEQWSVHLLFDSATTLSDFQRYCVERADVALELDRLYNPVEGAPTVESELTTTQRETLIAAYEAGYFDIPRKITLVDLAEGLDVSDQAVSERMRRGEAKLIETHLLEE